MHYLLYLYLLISVHRDKYNLWTIDKKYKTSSNISNISKIFQAYQETAFSFYLYVSLLIRMCLIKNKWRSCDLLPILKKLFKISEKRNFYFIDISALFIYRFFDPRNPEIKFLNWVRIRNTAAYILVDVFSVIPTPFKTRFIF